MLVISQEEELERIQSMTINEAVAYVNRLSRRLNRNDCTHEERKAGLVLLERLTERARFLNIPIKSTFSRTS